VLKFEWDKAKAEANLRKHGISFEESMSKDKNELRAEYRRQDLGKGVRGKFFKRFKEGTNLILLDDEVAKAFPTSEAVNEALHGLLVLARQSARIPSRSSSRDAERGSA